MFGGGCQLIQNCVSSMVSGRSRATAGIKVDPELMMTAGPVSSDLALIFCSLIPVSKRCRTSPEI